MRRKSDWKRFKRYKIEKNVAKQNLLHKDNPMHDEPPLTFLIIQNQSVHLSFQTLHFIDATCLLHY